MENVDLRPNKNRNAKKRLNKRPRLEIGKFSNMDALNCVIEPHENSTSSHISLVFMFFFFKKKQK